MARVYLGFGSNLGDRAAHLCAALRLLRERGVSVTRVSSLYETDPVGYTRQPAFLNAVAEAETDLAPEELLRAALEVERALGRERAVRWGPRTVDVDLLLYDDLQVAAADLTLPHPRMHERRFVLLPLLELWPGAAIPGAGPAAECLAALDPAAQPARRLGPLECP